MKNSTFFSRLLLVALFCGGSHFLQAQSVIPVPLQMEQTEGAFVFKASQPIYTNLQGEELKLLNATVSSLKYTDNLSAVAKGHIVLEKTESNVPESAEGYTLSVTPQGIRIASRSDAGLYYGLMTVKQMSEKDGGNLRVPACLITDQPRFAYRGFMMDVSRHFRSKEFVKKQIDAMAQFKLNRLHLHLTDGAGWRIEIKKYPRLTEFAAWRPDAVWKDWWLTDNGRQYCDESTPGAYRGHLMP